MSLAALSWAEKVEGLEPGPKLVLILLANAHNDHTGECFPKQETLQTRGGWKSVRSVQTHLSTLEEVGLIKRTTVRFGKGKGSRTNYFLDTQNLRLQTIDTQIDVDRHADIDTIDTQPASCEEQELEPERTYQHVGCAQQSDVDPFWEIAPRYSRQRSSKANVKTALTKLLKQGQDLDQILAAWSRYVGDLKATKKTEYAKGIHSWLNNQMFDAWIPDEPPPNGGGGARLELGSIEWCFASYVATGKWPGAHFGFDLAPERERADYPAALYEKYNIKKFEAVS